MSTLPRQIKHRPIGLTPVHITIRLKDSLPRKELDRLMQEREALYVAAEKEIDALPNEVFAVVSKRYLQQIAEDFELIFDQALHEKSNGPYHLAKPDVRQVIFDSWHWLAEHHGLYVYAICIMSNHVHILVRGPEGQSPLDPAMIMKGHKSFTSRECAKLLDRVGEAFWEKNYFDRDVREGTFTRVMWYILNNPVSAGLVDHWEDWPGTWLHPDFDDLFRNPG
jgi:REP element-mobilizing transposase RayT